MKQINKNFTRAILFIAAILAFSVLPARAIQWVGQPVNLTGATQTAIMAVNNYSSQNGYVSVGFNISGTWVATITFEATVDGTNWVSVKAVNANTGSAAATTTSNGIYSVAPNVIQTVRARVSAYTSGTIVVIPLGSDRALSGGNGGGDASASNQTNGSQLTQVVDSLGNKVGVTSNNLNVQCANCSGSGASAVDTASFTTGSSVFAPMGGFFQTTATANALSNGRQGMAQMTATRSVFMNPRDSTGKQFGTAGVPFRVDPTGTTTQPVSGTVGATQSGTWTVQPGNTANTTAWKVDGSAVTQPVSGTVTANVGITNGLALDATVGRAQGSTTSGQSGPLVQGAVTTAAPSYTTAQTSPLSLTTAGALRTDASATTQPVSGTVTANAGSGTFAISAASLPLPSGASTAAKQPALGTAGSASADVITVQGIASMTALKVDGSAVTQPVSISGNQAVNVAQINGVTPLMGNGTTGTGSQRVTIASDNTAFSVNATATGAAAHGASISGNPVRIGLRAISADITAVTGGQTTDWVATLDGKAINKPYAIRASAWGYASPANGLVNTTAVKVKAGASGLRVCLTSAQVINENGTTSSEIVVYASPGDGASTDTLYRWWGQAGGGGVSAPIALDRCTPNTGDSLMVVEKTATATNGILVNTQGYTSAE